MHTDIYLDSRIDSLCIHHVIFHRIQRYFLRSSEYSLPEDKLAVPSSESGGVGGTMGHRRVLGHGHGAPLVPLPLRQDVGYVLVPFDKVLGLRVNLEGEILIISSALQTSLYGGNYRIKDKK